jgi:hypothetical protein
VAGPASPGALAIGSRRVQVPTVTAGEAEHLPPEVGAVEPEPSSRKRAPPSRARGLA